MNPEGDVAREFMKTRGYRNAPTSVERVEDDFCWYYYYDLPEGELELEVSWSESVGWAATVTDFSRDRTNDDRVR